MRFTLWTSTAAIAMMSGLAGCSHVTAPTDPPPDLSVAALTGNGEAELAALVTRISTLKANVEAAGRIDLRFAAERDQLGRDIANWGSQTGRADLRAAVMSVKSNQGTCSGSCPLFSIAVVEEGLRVCILVEATCIDTIFGGKGWLCVSACFTLSSSAQKYWA